MMWTEMAIRNKRESRVLDGELGASTRGREWVPPRERQRRVREAWEERENEKRELQRRLLKIAGPNPGEDAPG